MGDVVSLVEEVERKVDKAKAEKLAKKIGKGKRFDLEDYKDQMEQMQSMGGIMGMIDKLPGMDKIPQKALNQMGDKKTEQISNNGKSANTEDNSALDIGAKTSRWRHAKYDDCQENTHRPNHSL